VNHAFFRAKVVSHHAIYRGEQIYDLLTYEPPEREWR